MTQLNYCLFPDRAVLRLSGTDCQSFLQNLVTCNVDNLQKNEATFGGLLTPQGKILYDFFLVRTERGYLMDIPAQMSSELTKRLTFYKLRADVTITIEEAITVTSIWRGDAETEFEPPENHICISDPRLPELGRRLYGEPVQIGEQKQRQDFDALRIKIGMPQSGTDYAYGDAFPHEALFDQIGAVDFRKGCYVGQEVVSRMHHRGTARKRVVKAHLQVTGAALPLAITANEKPVGEVTSMAGSHGLAMVRLDRVQRAREKGEKLMAGGKEVSLDLQDWVDFSWPASESAGN